MLAIYCLAWPTTTTTQATKDQRAPCSLLAMGDLA
jgi:hypothetical protein